MTARRFLRVILVIGALALGAFPVAGTLGQDSISVRIQRNAFLRDGGQSVTVRVQLNVDCDPSTTSVLEAFVYVTQAGNQSDFAPLPVACGAPPRMHHISVPVLEEATFVRGEANVSAFVLLINEETGDTLSVSPFASVVIR
jgi:hypothetical protein